MKIHSAKRSQRFASALSLSVLSLAVLSTAPASASTPTGSISGTVTNAQTTAGLEGVCVSAYGTSTPFTLDATTTSGGAYTFSALANGTYTIVIDPTCNGADSSSLEILTLPTITITSGSTLTNVNAALVLGGFASGTVGAGPSSTGIAGVCVTLTSPTGGGGGASQSASNGSFTVSNIAPGTYSLRVIPGCPYDTKYSSIYAPQTLPEPVTVSSGMTVADLSVTLVVGASVSGTVRSTVTNAAVDGAIISASYTTGPFIGQEAAFAVTQSNGAYKITGLSSGEYEVSFNGSETAGPNAIGTNSDLAAEQLPKVLTVTDGTTSSHQNFTLFPMTYDVAFTARGYSLTRAEKRELLSEARTIVPGSAIAITGYALNNRGLAKKRGDVVAAYLKSTEHLATSVSLVTTGAFNKAVIVNHGYSRDPAR
jgi:hypothetical protein